jgi:UDP-3-O-[3-hydroxymyristoyl] glucosamine N-acyltransferase
MTEPCFDPRPSPMSVAEIAALTGAQLLVSKFHDRKIHGIAALDRAGPTDLTFLDGPKYAEQLASTRAGACLIAQRFENTAPAGIALLRAAEPYRAFVLVSRQMYSGALRPSSLFAASGAAAGAIVHASARLEAGVSIDPGAVVGPHAEIGSGTIIAANAVIGTNVRIGRDCAIGAGVSITHAIIGDRVIIHPGCCIGQDGFGYVMGASSHQKVPQIGRVIIQDDVEIGAGTMIDRGAIRDTVIGEGTKIDNLVQIGHNVTIGRHCVLVGQTGISGSVSIEDFVVLGARVGVNNHVTIGEGAQIAATGIVHGNVPAGARWGGMPAKPVKRWFREMRMVERMAERHENSAEPAGPDIDGDEGAP